MKWSVLILLLLLPFLCFSQIEVFLLMEDQYTNKRIKYYVGQTLKFTTIYDPDNWQKARIKEISPEHDMVLFKDQYVHINEFHKIGSVNSNAQFAGNLLYGAGASIAVIGGLGYVSDGLYSDAVVSVVIGGLIAFIGRQIKKIFGHRKHKLEKKWIELRIVDTRFFVPGEAPRL